MTTQADSITGAGKVSDAAEILREAKEREFSLVVIGQGSFVKCIALNDLRIAGGKAWGGGYVIAEFKVKGEEVLRAIGLDRAALALLDGEGNGKV